MEIIIELEDIGYVLLSFTFLLAVNYSITDKIQSIFV